MIERRKSRQITVGDVVVGGDAPIAVQSMTKTDTSDARATAAQIHRLEKAGCEIIRVAVPNKRSLKALHEIKKQVRIPIVADIQFDAALALGALEAGADAVRVNPGNLRPPTQFRNIATAARRLGRAVRIGVNTGSLHPHIAAKKNLTVPEKMVESALDFIEIADKAGLRNCKISLKSSDVETTLAAYRKIALLTDAPLHLGITEAGDGFYGAIRSAVGIGILLAEGIGDTIRVSLTAKPELEVRAAWEILRSLGLRRRGVEIISCPACSRTNSAELRQVAEKIRKKTASLSAPFRIAVMGCMVNGPGESRDADYAVILIGARRAALYAGGKPLRKISLSHAADAIIGEIKKTSTANIRPE